jgi:sugar lactone lactonase YvrE
LALGIVLAVLLSGTGLAHAQWTKATTNGTKLVTDCILLTDGTVMCQLGETTNKLVRLTPDNKGSYVNGTWSTTNITSLPTTYQPRFFCSVVLPDGRVIFTGGEYNMPGNQAETTLGYIFDPTASGGLGLWTQITPPDNGTGDWTQIGDSPCIVLANGTFVIGDHSNTQMAALDPVTLTYTDLNPTGRTVEPNGNANPYAEEGWTLLPDGTILSVDINDGTNSEIYNPATNAWSSAGSTGVTLAGNGGPGNDPEMGPAVLRGDNGFVIQFGATPNNASYDYTEGLWVSAPSFPIPFVCGGISYENAGVNDGPASILPDGHVLVAANPVDSSGNAVHCSIFFEFDGTNLNPVPGDTDAPTKPAFGLRMLALPSGDVMVEDGSANVWFYNNNEPSDPGAQPKITTALSGVVPGQTYPISGTLFNGVSQGAFYGDDGEWATNYPLVRITTNGNVVYARTHNHSSMGVAMPDTIVTTYFDVPAYLALGASTTLEVVANGIPSAPLPINVVATGSTLAYDGGTVGGYGGVTTVGALLNSQGGSQPPIAGARVAFQLGSQNCSGTTDGTGFAGCTIVANQTPGAYTVTASFAGNSSYGASSASTSFNIIPAIQTITFTTSAPSSAATNSSFTVAASASSGLAVTYTSSGQCSNVGANYTMSSDTGTCTVIANQAGDADYVAAPAVTESVTVTAATVSFAYAQLTVPASGLKSPDGVAVDGASDVFIADESNNRVVKVTPSGVQTTIGSGLSSPDGVAVDGAGDVFIADFANNRVVEVTPSGVQTTVAGTGATPTGVAVDGAGDVFTAAYGEQEVLETPAGCTSSSCVIAVWGNPGGTTLLLPLGVAVDKAGDVFIPVTGTSSGVIKVTPPYKGVYSYIGSGLNGPTGVAVDGAGDVFIADTGNNRVVELPVGGGAQTTVGSGLTNPNGVAVDGSGDVFISEGSSKQAVEVQREAVNFGYVNVCPAGQSSPAPCKESLTLNYIANGTSTVGSINVRTQGAANLDFTLTGNTCTGTLTSGSTCRVTVTFSPRAPGARSGAVQLAGVGTVLATTFVHGESKAPAIAFGPGAQITLPTRGLNAPSSVAVDALGDVFIPDRFNNQVVELPAGCVSSSCQTTLSVIGLSNPSDVAVDGEGNIYIADTLNNRVVKLMPIAIGFDYATVGSGLALPTAVAVDGAGNVFIATNGNEVVEVPTGGGPQITLVSSLAFPSSVAADGAGNVYIADSGNNRVLEVPAGCISSTCQITVPAIGLNGPESVAVDGAGDVYITDQRNNRVIEVPAGGGPQTTVMSGLNLPEGVAVDGAGNVFIADENNHRVVEMQRSKPPMLSFGATNVGSASAPQSVTVQNIGNQPLDAVSPGLVVIGPNFLQVAGSGTPADCTSSFALAPGTTCNLSISFQPTSAGSLTSRATFTDNALNTSPAVSQSVALQGTGNSSSSPAVTLTPTSLNFGAVATDVTSAVKTVTLKNSGNATLTISSIAISGTNSGDFPETTTCTGSLAAGASCSLKVQFRPSATGARSAAVSISDNAAGSPQQVPLSGTGTTAKLAPTPLGFGTLTVGLTSAVKKVTLTNLGTTTLSISSITVTGSEAANFPETTTCGSSLAAAASCTISLEFKASTTGARSANLTVTDNAAGSPQQVPLSGTGTTAELTPASLSFGSVTVGSTSVKTVTLKNVGTTAITITSITVAGTDPGDFVQSNGCGSSLAASASCTISVTFKPTITGARSATLKLTDSAAGSPQQVPLSGTGS